MNIPAAALEAGARAITMALILAVEDDCRALSLTDDERAELARAACLAMINAWPGMATEFRRDSYMGWDGNLIILPLTEKTDGI